MRSKGNGQTVHEHQWSERITFPVKPPGRIAPWRICARQCGCGAYSEITNNGCGQHASIPGISTTDVLTLQQIEKILDDNARAVTTEAEKRKAGGHLHRTQRVPGADERGYKVLPGRR